MTVINQSKKLEEGGAEANKLGVASSQQLWELIKTEWGYLQAHFPLLEDAFHNKVSIDLETEPIPGNEDNDKAALSPWTGRITLIGIVGYVSGQPYVKQYSGEQLDQAKVELANLIEAGVTITGHNFKFDAKFLIKYQVLNENQTIKAWDIDSSILSVLTPKMIPKYWEERYNEQRDSANAGRKHKHRKAGTGSLKMLAPFHLGVEPFWESEDHNNSKYNLLDCLYTFYLTIVLNKQVNDVGASQTARDLIDRAKLLLVAELEGVCLDIAETKTRLIDNEGKLTSLETKLKAQWAPQYEKWRVLQLGEIKDKYVDMCMKYSTKRNGIYEEAWANRYEQLYLNAISKAQSDLNLNSTQQLTWLLKEELGLDITGLDGEEATDKEVLGLLAEQNPEINVLMEYKAAKKLQSTYYPELLEFAKHDGRIHCNFNITGARTGRLSSSGPNLQNQPGHLHDLFIAAPGNVLITKDLSALEPVLIAYFTEDKNLVELVQSGASFHSVNAKQMFGLNCSVEAVAKEHPKERKAAKEFGLSILYGAGAKRVQQSLSKYGYEFSIDACKGMVQRIRDYYSGVWAFKKALDKMLENGEVIYNLFNRPIRILDPEDVYMTGFNTLIQGSGSDALLQASVDLIKENNWIRPRLWVHDELVVEVPESRAKEAEQLVEYHMTKFELPTKYGPVKLKVEGGVDKTWKK